jgi:hypothetical protein
MNITQSFNQAISRSIATAGNQAKRHFFSAATPHTPRAQGLGIKLFSGWFYQISVTSSCVLQTSLSIKKIKSFMHFHAMSFQVCFETNLLMRPARKDIPNHLQRKCINYYKMSQMA